MNGVDTEGKLVASARPGLGNMHEARWQVSYLSHRLFPPRHAFPTIRISLHLRIILASGNCIALRYPAAIQLVGGMARDPWVVADASLPLAYGPPPPKRRCTTQKLVFVLFALAGAAALILGLTIRE